MRDDDYSSWYEEMLEELAEMEKALTDMTKQVSPQPVLVPGSMVETPDDVFAKDPARYKKLKENLAALSDLHKYPAYKPSKRKLNSMGDD